MIDTSQNLPLQDVHVRETVPLVSPRYLKQEETISDAAIKTVIDARESIKRILSGKESRLIVVVGPCSIHDHVAALEYARRLKALASRVEDNLLVIMRVYFEKPRTTVGWKGLINDPFLDGSFRINEGLRFARQLLIDINDLGLPAGCEFLDIFTPQYLADLVAWGAIGARFHSVPSNLRTSRRISSLTSLLAT